MNYDPLRLAIFLKKKEMTKTSAGSLLTDVLFYVFCVCVCTLIIDNGFYIDSLSLSVTIKFNLNRIAGFYMFVQVLAEFSRVIYFLTIDSNDDIILL